MAKTKTTKNKKGNNNNNKNESESESDQQYANDDDFDPKNPFDNDEVESFHANRDKILLGKLNPKVKKDFQYSSEEEVLAFEDDDDDDESDDEYDGKVYGSEEEDENADKEDDYNEYSSSWGQKKSAYYSGNKMENDEDAALEEEEARALQVKMMKQLDTNDFDLDAFKINKTGKVLLTGEEISAKKLASNALGDLEKADELKDEMLQKIAKNLDKMSKKEKFDFLQQDSPELFELVRDFKEKLVEFQEILLPLFKSIKSGQLPHSPASEFILNKTKLYLMYCSHLCFYFVLKSQRSPVENHPIVKNILQFRNLCKQLSVIDQKLDKEIKFLVSSIKSNKQISFVKSIAKSNGKRVNFKLRPMVKKSIEDDTESEMDEEEIQKAVAESTEEKVDKRAINYQIEKNKGLTPRRNKMYRNPRVRNRVKAHRAIVKRKSIVPVRTQEKRYSGEATGIRMSVVRGVKIK